MTTEVLGLQVTCIVSASREPEPVLVDQATRKMQGNSAQ